MTAQVESTRFKNTERFEQDSKGEMVKRKGHRHHWNFQHLCLIKCVVREHGENWVLCENIFKVAVNTKTSFKVRFLFEPTAEECETQFRKIRDKENCKDDKYLRCSQFFIKSYFKKH